MSNPEDQPFFTSSEALVAQEQKLLRERRSKSKDAPWLALALSGGGIRSATFCLGALQALAARGLLGKFDYISSVSGGGYIGCALQWWWTRRNAAGAPKFGSDATSFPYGIDFGLPDRTISDDILNYLRAHGRYLTPGDGLTAWSGISVVLRTLFLNLFVWLSAATLIFCVLLELSPESGTLPAWVNPFPGIIYSGWDGAPHLCGGGGIGSVKTLTVSGVGGATATVVGPQSNCVLKYPLSFAPFAWLAYLIALFFIFYSLALSFMSWVDSPEFAARSKFWQRATPSVALLASLVLTGACVYFARPLVSSSFYDAKSLALFSSSGIGAMLVVTSLLFIITASNYVWRRRFEVSAGKCFIYGALLFALGSVPLIPYYLMNYGGPFSAAASVAISLLGGISSAAFGHADQTRKKIDGLFTSLVAAVGSLVFLYAVLVTAYFLAQLAVNTGEIVGFSDDNAYSIVRAAVYSICAIATFLILFTNINLVGLHRFYRDRLMETFMPSEAVVREPATTYSLEADNLKLTDLWPETGAARDVPYPIINTNVILVNDDEAKVRLRGGASFMLSPWYVGSDVTGWESAKRHAKKNGSITLASAMAASGAAANSNAGFVGTGVTRNRIVSVIMGLLNLRLGVWVNTPSMREASTFSRRPNLFSPGLRYNLLRFGYHRGASYSELSDGGHFDNLGIYELVRRRAKLIMAFDAEADGETNLASLVSVVQRVRDDFDAIIDLERCADHLVPRLDEALFPPGARWTDAPYFSAPITYSGGERARLIYVKASLLRKLSFLAKAYRAANSDFPHQSTLDQFFDGSQFEAYRELGFRSTVAAIEQLKLESYIGDPNFLAGL
jgi:predicted acylesterase/phospholipase RssA